MLKTTLAVFLISAGLGAGPVLAQSDTAGETRSAPSKPATKEERAAARAKRQAEGKELGKQDAGRLEDPVNKGQSAKPKATKEEKAAARAKRNAEGKELGKQDAGRLEETSPTSR